MDTTRPGRTVRVSIVTVRPDQVMQHADELATEEPLEIRVVSGDRPHERQSIAVTMRTPGHDFALAAGFLYTEGVIADREAIASIAYCTDSDEPQQYNIVNLFLRPSVPFDIDRLSRHVYTTSSCGVCGKASIELVRASCLRRPSRTFRPRADLFYGLPETLRQAQAIFSRTGGLHASALFDTTGQLALLREDVGRHNAMDKVIGELLLESRLPASDSIMLASGRTSFELVQKVLMAGIPVLAGVGAPSSLAVELARTFDLTLIGFLRDGRFNVYSGADGLEMPT